MILKPRPYQLAATDSTFEYLACAKGNPIVAMPTGSGKSVVIAMTVQRALAEYPYLRMIKLTHVKTLIQQNLEKLLGIWPSAPVGVYSAGLDRREISQITFAGIATVVKLAKEFGYINVILIDEAHLVSNADETMYKVFIDELRKINPNLVVIGYSATPWRMGLGNLIKGGIFTDTCFDNTSREAFNELIDDGYLCRLVPKSTKFVLNTEGVHSRGGEFIASELEAAINTRQITYQALSETMLLAEDRKHWIIYTAGVDHCDDVCEMLVNEFGVDALPVHSKLKKGEAEEAIRKFKAGEVRCLVNNGMLTTGVDFPMLDCIVILRPTKSAPLWVQILGRGTRCVYEDGYDLELTEGRLAAIAASAKPNCLVLDFARNTPRLGPINDPVIPKTKESGGGGGTAPIKTCAACNTYNHATVRYCTACGEEFHHAVKFGVVAGTDELIAGVKEVEEPQVETFKVSTITYMRHEAKKDGSVSMKVTYVCGFRAFTEYICFEHKASIPRRKARMWWRERFPLQPGQTEPWTPETVAQALQYIGYLRVPVHIDVWVNRKYPEITRYSYDQSSVAA